MPSTPQLPPNGPWLALPGSWTETGALARSVGPDENAASSAGCGGLRGKAAVFDFEPPAAKRGRDVVPAFLAFQKKDPVPMTTA